MVIEKDIMRRVHVLYTLIVGIAFVVYFTNVLQTRAQEEVVDVVQEEQVDDTQTGREMLQTQRAERVEARTEAHEEALLLREEGGSPDEFAELRAEQREERADMRALHQEEIQTWFGEEARLLHEHMEERKAEREAMKEERRSQIGEYAQERLTQLIERITERMNAAANRLEQITDRTLSRLETIERDSGRDLSITRDQLEQVYIALYDVRQLIVLFNELATEVLVSDDPRARMQEVRQAAILVKNTIKEVHGMIVVIVQTLKEEQLSLDKVNEDDVDATEVSEGAEDSDGEEALVQ